MIEITEEELAELFKMVNTKMIYFDRLEAIVNRLVKEKHERKPRGYLEQKIEFVRAKPLERGLHTVEGLVAIKRDIASIFYEERNRWLGNATQLPATSFTVALESLKHRICGEGE